MDANLDLLLTVVYSIADDFLPKRVGNARRKISDPEIVALCVCAGDHGDPVRSPVLGGRRDTACAPVPAGARARCVPQRRLRLSPQIEALIAHFARQSPGFFDDLLLVRTTA
jgi:hypothetical protein